MAAPLPDPAFLRELAEHIPGMAYRVHLPQSPGGAPYYSFVSPGVRGLYGVPPEALLADPRVLRPFRHPDDVAAVDAAVAAATATSAPLNVAYRIVVDGRQKWVQMSSSVVPSDPGEQVRVGVMIDITAQRVAEALQRERDRAETERSHMTQFLSRVSHELRTPLNAILGLAELIATEADTPALQRGWANTLRGSGDHLLALVEDVLDLSGAASGQMAVRADAVDLAAVLGEAWMLVRGVAESRGLHFDGVPPAAAERVVRADRRRLLQVLTNLLSNAVKYNRPGGRITVAVRHEEPEVAIAVTDEGPGLTPEQQARLFIPFERLGAAQSGVPGAGLGLALSRQLAEAMGGTLRADSEPGQGSTFTLRLRAAAA